MHTIGELVARARERIEELAEQYDEDNLLIQAEELDDFRDLDSFLNKYRQCDLSIFIEYLNPFCRFFADRWHRLKKTDHNYNLRANSFVNRVYIIFAEEISKACGVDLYAILMPTVVAANPRMSRDNLSDFDLIEFIVADDDDPIEIVKCLDDAYRNRTLVLRKTTDPRQILNPNESLRVKNHSIQAKNYYNAIQKFLNSGTESDMYEVQIAREALVAAMHDKSVDVTASYGSAGIEQLCKNLKERYPTRLSFTGLLMKFPKNNWKKFLKYFSDRDLKEIFLNNNLLRNIVVDKETYIGFGDDTNKRALLFAFTVLYWRDRKRQSENKTSIGWFANQLGLKSYFGAYNKDDKKGFVKLFLEFLNSGFALNDLRGFLESKNITDVDAVLEAMKEGDLGIIVKQAFIIGDPVFKPIPARRAISQ